MEIFPPTEWTLAHESAAEEARIEISRWCEPAPHAVLFAELSKLRVALAHRNAETPDEKTLALVFADDVGEFPADVIRQAARDWRRSERWFPSPADLRARCAALARQRVALRDSLQRIST